jgi:hypothetical protein
MTSCKNEAGGNPAFFKGANITAGCDVLAGDLLDFWLG